jgi:hypothetical protein
MKYLLLCSLLVAASALAVNSPPKKSGLFFVARRDIGHVLSSKELEKYSDFNIVSIRQGAGPGPAMTYFVSLEKPFETKNPESRTCLMFQSKEKAKWEMIGKPGQCKFQD